jgi:hypothetical protein
MAIVQLSREHHDELMREFALLALAAADPGATTRSDVPARLVELVAVLGEQYGGAASEPDAAVDAAIARGEESLDVSYVVPREVVDAADRLEAILQEADEFCRSEQLLTLARSDIEVRFAEWYLDEFRRQIGGEPPRPWDGPLQP